MKIIPSKPASQSMEDLDRVLRAYQPPGALVPPASFAREGADLRTLVRLHLMAPTAPAGFPGLVWWRG
jgi:hypothetical protein